jgi:hypothetical protein
VKKIVLLATAALVAMLILVPTAMAQDTMMMESTTVTEATVMDGDLPTSGGPSLSVLLPAGALLLGSGVLAFALLRRR